MKKRLCPAWQAMTQPPPLARGAQAEPPAPSRAARVGQDTELENPGRETGTASTPHIY